MRRTVGIGLIVAVIGALAFSQYLNFSGFCYSQSRYLSDEELVSRAIEDILERPPPGQEKAQYRSVAEFRQLNLDCCKIFRDKHERLIFENYNRILGWYNVMTEIWYKVNNDNPTAYYEAFIALNACGDVGNRGGWRQSRAPQPQPR